MSEFYVKKENIKLEMKDGFAKTEMLAGTYDKGVRCFQCKLEAGCMVRPEMEENTLQVYAFTAGKGAILTEEEVFAVNEVSFFVPDPYGKQYTIAAATDLVYTLFVVTQTEEDQKRYDSFHVKTPVFKPLSKCTEYCQSCKSASTRSYSVIPTKRLCRVLMGVVMVDGTNATEPEGCVEKGHPAVAQWNVPFGDSHFTLDVEGEVVELETGDFSYVEAGLDHALCCKPGKRCDYIWFEHYVQEKDYLISYPQSR